MLFLTPNQQCQSPKGKWQLRRNTINVKTVSYLIRPWWNPRARWFSNENSRKHLHSWDNTFSSPGEVCSKYTTYVLQIKSVNCVAKDVSKKCALLPQKRRWETHLPYWGQWDHSLWRMAIAIPGLWQPSQPESTATVPYLRQYSFPILLRAGGWVGPCEWLHTDTVLCANGYRSEY